MKSFMSRGTNAIIKQKLHHALSIGPCCIKVYGCSTSCIPPMDEPSQLSAHMRRTHEQLERLHLCASSRASEKPSFDWCAGAQLVCRDEDRVVRILGEDPEAGEDAAMSPSKRWAGAGQSIAGRSPSSARSQSLNKVRPSHSCLLCQCM